jgi:hypothetical protein
VWVLAGAEGGGLNVSTRRRNGQRVSWWMLRLRGVGVEDDFRPAVVAVVEVLVGVGSFFEGKLVGDDEGWIGSIVVDEVHEPPVVGFDVALAGAHLLALEPELAEVKRDLPLLLQSVFRLWVLGSASRSWHRGPCQH